MKERRGFIESISQAEDVARLLGATSIEHYAFTDRVYPSPSGRPLEEDFVRLRVRESFRPPTLKATLVRKSSTGQAEMNAIINRDFESEAAAQEALRLLYREEPSELFRFARRGTSYSCAAQKATIYLEEVERAGSMIEIESEDEALIDALLSRFGVVRLISGSLAQHLHIFQKGHDAR
jgi:hypothetical protein